MGIGWGRAGLSEEVPFVLIPGGWPELGRNIPGRNLGMAEELACLRERKPRWQIPANMAERRVSCVERCEEPAHTEHVGRVMSLTFPAQL